MMEMSTTSFKSNVTQALADRRLQYAMTETGPRFIQKRTKARDALPEFDALRDQSRDIKDHVLEHLDIYLEHYEAKVKESGGHVHWARTADEACAIIVGIAKGRGAKTVAKGKSMVSEEIGLNAALERAERRALYCQSLVSTFVQSARDAYPGSATHSTTPWLRSPSKKPAKASAPAFGCEVKP